MVCIATVLDSDVQLGVIEKPDGFLNTRWYLKTLCTCDSSTKSLAVKISFLILPVMLLITLIMDFIAFIKGPKIEVVAKQFTGAENVDFYKKTMVLALELFKRETGEVEKKTCIKVNVPYTLRIAPYTTEVHVVNKSTMRTAQDLVNRGLNPLVMDMANAFEAGGGVRRGANAQEEILCRQSNLMYGLLKMEGEGKFPLPEKGGVLLPKSTFFRADPNESYAFLEVPFEVDVFALAAYCCIPGNSDRPTSDEEYKANTIAKIENYLNVAIENGNDSIVASALGCGAFKNDSAFIAGLFKEILEKPQYKGQFKEVAFGIIGDTKCGGPKSNYQVFKEVLG